MGLLGAEADERCPETSYRRRTEDRHFGLGFRSFTMNLEGAMYDECHVIFHLKPHYTFLFIMFFCVF